MTTLLFVIWLAGMPGAVCSVARYNRKYPMHEHTKIVVMVFAAIVWPLIFISIAVTKVLRV